ncbi:WD40 repeat-like protein [Penicillium odoratum]|uniref:WD40 repeat-like protein n=1 Tax=Penicillium odoratum TaxID=1167516 RepID=UPI00254658B3|nr:WD40 repeat-like protein [Penicillium odoratum]KAJ5760948.1 WD40 repeat-like protein [Penicillium odoratum]
MSIIRHTYQHLVPNWISGLPKVEKLWSPLLQTFESDQVLYGAAFSPDGKLVASSAACLYDSATGTLLKTLDVFSEDKEDSIRGTTVTFSQDGKRVISISLGGWLRVWDVSSGLLITEVKSSVRGGTPHWRLFSHDKTLAVALLNSNTVEVIDIANGLLLKTFQPHGGVSVSSLALSRDGQTLASASETGVTQLWNAVAITPKRELRRHYGELMLKTRLAFSPDGNILAAWSNRYPISLWDPASGELLGEIPGWFHDACFLPDSKVLLMSCDSEGDDAGFVKLWDVSSGKLVKTIEAGCLGLQLSPNGRFFASVPLCYGARGWERGGREIRVWDITTGNIDKTFYNPFGDINWLSFSADNTLLVTVSDLGYTIQLWDLVTQSKSLEEFQLESFQIDGFKLSPDRKIAASITSSRTSVSIWDMETGIFLKRLRGGHCSFSPDSNWVLVSNKFTDDIWNLATWELALSAPKGSVTLGGFAFSPDGELFAHEIVPLHEDRVANIDTENLNEQPLVKIWHTDTWKPLLTFGARYKYQSTVLSFSPNSKLLACAIHDNLDQSLARETLEVTFNIWNVITGKRQRVFTIPVSDTSHWVKDLAWSPDGSTVISFTWDQSVRVWDVATGQLKRTFDRQDWTSSITLSPDGLLLAGSRSRDIVDLWEVQTGMLIGTRYIPGSWRSLQFSVDNNTMMTAMGRIDVEKSFPSRALVRNGDFLVDSDWVVYGTDRILLLPVDY